MKICITTDDGQVAELNVEKHQQIGTIAFHLQQHFRIEPESQVLLFKGNIVRRNLTFSEAGIGNDDLLVLIKMHNSIIGSNAARASNSSTSTTHSNGVIVRKGMKLHEIPQNPTAELLLDIMDKNPHLVNELRTVNPDLAEALHSKKLEDVRHVLIRLHMDAASHLFNEQQAAAELDSRALSPSAQAKIEESIRLSNVQRNMETAIEELPEAFGKVYMLYIGCEVNGTKVKAFVDSGAQSTIMSSSCAERCGIMRLVDKRFAGQERNYNALAVGVGTAKIIGRVHLAPMKIGNYFYNCSFTILDQQSVDFLFGLDMLKRHQCCIDLHKNVLRLHEEGGFHEVPFLPENEIPVSAQSISDNLDSSLKSADSTHEGQKHERDSNFAKVKRLVGLGFDENLAHRALETSGGDVDMAAALLFEGLE